MKMKTNLRRRAALLLLAVLCSFTGAWAVEVEIGSLEGAGNDSFLPMNSLYNYSYSQQIYTGDEIGTVGTINAITVWLYGNEQLPDMSFDIYMVETTKGEFESSTDWISVTAGDLVYSGTVTVHNTEAQAYTFTLDTPFAYSGTGNLAICFNNMTGAWKSGLNGKVFGTGDDPTRAIYARQDESEYDPTDPTFSAYGRTYKRNVIVLDITPSGVFYAKPTNLAVSDLTAHAATVSWTAPAGSPTGYAYQYKKASDTEWSTETIVTSPSVPLSGLIAETAYNFQVKAKYSGGESGYAAINFTTPIACPKPTDLTATLTPGNGTVATLNWTENGTATNWVLEYGTDSEFSGATSVNVSGTPTKDFTGLTPETTYYARVKATQGGDESAWSKTVSFTPTNDYSVLVNDGTATNGYVPVYGMWVDKFSMSQFIIPAADLAAMQYGNITKLTFYATNNNISWGAAEFEVYMTEVPETTFSSATLLDWNDMEKVMNKGTLAISDNKMVITLDASYQYLGGNLLIGVRQMIQGTYTSCSWQGVSSEENVALGGYGSDVNNGSNVGFQKFLPKTTISYTPGTAPSVLKPTNLAVNYTGGKTAEVSWTSTESGFDIDVNGTVTQNVTNPYTLTGLDLSTTYEVKVRAKNSSGVSDWTNPVSFTTDGCENATVVNYSLVDSYGDGWDGNIIYVVDSDGNIIEDNEGNVIAVTIESGASASGTLRLCGDYLEFVWYKGSYPGECSWSFTDVNGNVLFSGQGDASMQTGDVLHVIDNGACPRPTDLAVSEIGPRSAKLSWTENGTANKWKIYFFDAGDNITDIVTANSNPFTLTGLTPETDYTIRIIAVNGSDESDLSRRFSFTTSTATPAPTDLAVSHIGPTNATATWNGFAENYDIEWAEFYSSADWLQYNDGSLKSNVGSSSGGEWTWGVMYPASMLTDKMTLTKIAFYEVDTSNYMDGSVTVKVYSGGDTAPGTLLYTETIATESTNDMREVILSTPVEFDVSENLWITLTANATYCMTMSEEDGGENSRWFLNGDDWVDFGTVYTDGANDSFMIWGYVNDLNLSSLSWSTKSDVTSPYTINGLTSETDCVVRVRGDFGSDGDSNWTYSYFTTTEMNPTPTDIEADLMADGATLTWMGYGDSYNVRYRTAESREYLFFEDFENVTGEDLPNGWTQIDADGDGYTWFSFTPDGYTDNYGNPTLFGASCATSASYDNPTSSPLTPDNWLISPQLDLQGTLSVWLRGQDPGWAAENFAIYVSTTGTDIADFVELVPETTAGAIYTEYTADLSSYSGQKGYIAIRHFDVTNMFRLNVDNFGIYNVTSADSWTTTTTGDATITLTELPTNTTYEYQIQSVSGGSTSEWSDIQSFALLTLQENADNSTLIADNIGRKAHVTLADHTLYKSVHYSTMCLPFDVVKDESPLADAMIRVLDTSNSSFDASTNTLNVTFKEFAGDVIPAGTPFVAIWLYGSNLTNPEFANVIMGSNLRTEAFTGGNFRGNFSPVTLTENEMYFGPDKTLSWPSTNVTIGSFRGRLQLENPQLNQPIDITINLMPGMVLTLRYLKGDANGDDSVSITDAVAVVNYILGTPSADFNRMNANVNGDADTSGNPNITITDAVGIVNIILNSTSTAPEFELEEVDTEVEPE